MTPAVMEDGMTCDNIQAFGCSCSFLAANTSWSTVETQNDMRTAPCRHDGPLGRRP